jgi:nitrogen fixation/metabolism regulation signal transduction histidine kinase
MASKNLYLNIILRCCFLAVSAILAGWIFFDHKIPVLGIMLAIIFVIQAAELIHFLNRTNRQIAFFFDAVRNDDTTLRFPENTGNKSVNELNNSLNRVNESIKNIKLELREQEQYFKTILEHVSIGIITFNKNGNIFLSNTAARNLLNCNPLTHINQLMRVDKKLCTAIKELQSGEQKLVNFNSKTGTVQLSLKSTLFKTAQEDFQLVAIQDIKNEMETKELESWIKLIRVLTHEIMNSVAPITSLSQTILGYYNASGENLPSEKVIGNTVKGLKVINERSAGLISFVETYRKLTRIPPPDKKPVSLEQLFESTITLVNTDPASKTITISREVSPPDIEIFADKKQISQVLINLVKNSMEALKTNSEGKIMLKGEVIENGRVRVTVTDSGPGIPRDLMDKIFIPFFTTKESGSGIGLSLSRQIMLLHGGSLKMISEPGKQTVAVLEF